MRSRYKKYHKILQFLYDDWQENNEEERSVGSIKISTKTKIQISEIHELQHVLVNNGDIVIVNNDGQWMLAIQPQGRSSYVDKKYIKEGAKQLWDGIFNWARILIPILALLLSGYIFFDNKSIAKRVEKLEKLKSSKK